MLTRNPIETTLWPATLTQNCGSFPPQHQTERVSDVNKTFLSRPRPRPRLWTSRPRPRPRLFSQDQGKTLLERPLNRLPYIFAMFTKWTQQYTHKVTRHTYAEAPTSVAYPRFLNRGGERTEESGIFFCIFCCCKYPIFTHSGTLLS